MRILWLTLAIFGAAVDGLSQVPHDDLARLETSWNEAHKNGDVAALDLLWADDLEVDVPRMLPMTKEEALAFARTGRMRFDSYETSGLKVRTYGTTAVVTGWLRRTRTVGGQQSTDDWRFTKVYARQFEQWRVVSFHASEAPAR
jgi:ketosteroid isomerase-like protein